MALTIRPLTQVQRQAAHRAAQEAVVRAVGTKPAREHYSSTIISKYPASVTRLITLLCLVLLLAAFTPSAIRLYVIGSQTFGQAVSNLVTTKAVGVATVLSAEVGQVVCSLALATLGTSRSACRLLYLSMGLATTIALTGNVQTALPGYTSNPFAWLEAVAPPLLVLATAYVLKEQVLESIEHRHTTERAYQKAVGEWQTAIANPESHPQWPQFYANALRDAPRKANQRRQEALRPMTQEDWRTAVTREMQADRWYQAAEQDDATVFPLSPTVETFTADSAGNGNRPKVSLSAV